jgi:RNA polymerase sigma-70 factor (ECF subfamily)
MPSPPLVTAFLEPIEDGGVRTAWAARGDLEHQLHRAWTGARASWPGIDLSALDFTAYLGQRVDQVDAALDALHLSDLYVACACAKGDALALWRFEADLMSPVDSTLRRLGLCDSDVDEAKQILRNRFFVGEGGSSPRILTYSGRGVLAGWVRSAATRVALRLLRRPKAEAHVEAEALAQLPSLDTDAELRFMRREHGPDFVAAFREAFLLLSTRDRTLLRQSFRHGLSIDKIGALHRVHRATAARWLADARQDLAASMHASLMRRLEVGRSTAYSIARLVEGEVSLPELLETSENPVRRRS